MRVKKLFLAKRRNNFKMARQMYRTFISHTSTSLTDIWKFIITLIQYKDRIVLFFIYWVHGFVQSSKLSIYGVEYIEFCLNLKCFCPYFALDRIRRWAISPSNSQSHTVWSMLDPFCGRWMMYWDQLTPWLIQDLDLNIFQRWLDIYTNMFWWIMGTFTRQVICSG